MFLEYFRLREQPFGVTPNPRFLFPSPGHREALASLIYGIESNLGFSALIAEPGMGKTTLVFHILEQYRQSARTAFIFNTQCDSYDLLRSLLSELDDNPVPQEPFLLHERFKQILAGEAKSRRRVILVIDEAQNLGEMVMETVRLLSNFESAQFKLLHIILAGQPELAAKLVRSDLSQLEQRIPILTTLPNLSREEIISYIEHRLRVAGCQRRSLFFPEALEQIALLSQGVPREINRICFNCLSLAYATSRSDVDLSVVEEVTADLELGTRIHARAVTARRDHTSLGGSAAGAASAAVELSQREEAGSLPGPPARDLPDTKTLPVRSTVTADASNPCVADTEPRRQSPGAWRPKLVPATSYSLSNGWRACRRPLGFALFYLLLMGAGWTAVTRWTSLTSSSAVSEGRQLASENATPTPPAKRTGSKNKTTPGRKAGEPNPEKAHSPDRSTATQTNKLRPGRSEALEWDLDSTVSTVSNPSRVRLELVRYVRPHYPDAARDRHIEGPVVFRAVVARDGKVTELTPVSGNPMLLKAAEEAMHSWVYRPYRVNGKAVDVDTEIVVNFSLPNERSP